VKPGTVTIKPKGLMKNKNSRAVTAKKKTNYNTSKARSRTREAEDEDLIEGGPDGFHHNAT